MAEIIRFDHLQQLLGDNQVTADGKYTKNILLAKVRKIVDDTIDSNEAKSDILKYVIHSFTTTGVVETYNDLGEHGWLDMIKEMIEIAITEE